MRANLEEETRRTVLKSLAGVGVNAPIISTHVAASNPDFDDPFESVPGLECWDDWDCPHEVVAHEWEIQNDETYETYGSCAFLWYGSLYSEDFDGWVHGIGLGGACQSEGNGFGSGPSLRGQRYEIVSNQDDSVIWRGTENHQSAVYPPEEGDLNNWAGYIIMAATESAFSYIDFNLPVDTLIDITSSPDGHDEIDGGYKYSNTGRVIPRELWDECIHTDAVIIQTRDKVRPTLDLKHSYRIYPGIISYWADVEYEITGFGETEPSKQSQRGPSSVRPEEMTDEELERWGVRQVESDTVTMEVNGEEKKVEPEYILTKNPFTVSNLRTGISLD